VRSASGALDTTGWLMLHAPLIVIHDSSSIVGSERGYKGGYMYSHPWGYGPGGGSAGGVSGGAGGGGAYGGNGGAGGGDYGGLGGIAYGTSVDTLVEMGSGGGAGRLTAVDGIGGNGGAAISLRGYFIDFDSSSITVDGQTGYQGSVEAGGGGSGGGILMWADTVKVHYTLISGNGGSGGYTMGFGGGGGAGGGRIKILYTDILDTTGLFLSIQGGAGGIADMGTNGDSGTAGTIHVAQYTGITELCRRFSSQLNIQPNPTRGIVKITIEDAPKEFMLCDISGRCVKIIMVSKNNESINLSTLKSGVYFLKSKSLEAPIRKIVLIH